METSLFLHLGLLSLTACPSLGTVRGDSATWTVSVSGNWNAPGNWNPATVPNGAMDTATFRATAGFSQNTDVKLTHDVVVDGIVFDAGASPYTITIGSILTLEGAGIANHSGLSQNFVVTSSMKRTQLTFLNSATAGNGHFTGGGIVFYDTATAGSGMFANEAGEYTNFYYSSTAGHAVIINDGATDEFGSGARAEFGDNSTAEEATITNQAATLGGGGGETHFGANSSAGNATLIAKGGSTPQGGSILFDDDTLGGTCRVKVYGYAFIDVSEHNSPGLTIGSLEGDGVAYLGLRNLTVGSNNLSTTFSGSIEKDGYQSGDIGGGSFTKIGTGTLVLDGLSDYTGPTSVDQGTLIVNGALASAVTVADGALQGGGHVKSLTNASTVAPGNGLTLHVDKNYIQQNGAILALEITGTQDSQMSQLSVGGKASLGTQAILELDFRGGFAPKAGDKFPLLNCKSIEGNFLPAVITGLASGFQYRIQPTSDGLVLEALNDGVAQSQKTPAIPLNISTRASVMTGQDVLIGGFIITGTQPKLLLVRALGPSLAAAGVPGALADPILELHEPDGTVVKNYDWIDSEIYGYDARKQQIIDTGLPPTNPLESAIVATLDPGAYTCVVSSTDGSTGTALVEVYDLDHQPGALLGNISSRANVGTGDNVMIAGFIVGGSGGAPGTVVARGLGPSLASAGITNPLQDPLLELRDSDGNLVVQNDNWMDGPHAQTIKKDGLAPTKAKEAALLATLQPGAYTAILRGVNNTTGVGLVEVYNVK